MKLDRVIRIALVAGVFLIFIIAIAALLFVTEAALNVWERLLQGPRWVLYAYLSLLMAFLLAACWLVLRFVVRRRPNAVPQANMQLSREDIEARLEAADAAGIDTQAAQAELRELASRQESGSVHLCFFGEVSAGKSALIKALVPDADVVIDAVAGSTTEIRHYRWRDEHGVQILLTDVPGTGGRDLQYNGGAEEEARRAQLVVFVCDSDLTRAESAAVRWLLELAKPLVLVLNKSDRYSSEEQSALMGKLLDQLSDLGSKFARDAVVAVSAGGEVDVVRRASDGSETITRRKRPADIGVLVVAINRLIENDPTVLDIRRDRAVFHLAAEKLVQAEGQYREQRAEQIIRGATRKAVFGALAAVSPGSDVVIQGYIGISLTKALCRLFGVSPRDLDVEEFLTLSQSRVGKALPLSLAVAGNGLKAFPGIGTVAGGLVHAVAYGLIFDALGHSLVQTLTQHSALDPATAAKEFEDGISGHIETGVQQVAQMAMERRSGRSRG